jgi:hypothetical protein
MAAGHGAGASVELVITILELSGTLSLEQSFFRNTYFIVGSAIFSTFGYSVW